MADRHGRRVSERRAPWESDTRLTATLAPSATDHLDLASIGRWIATTRAFALAVLDGGEVRAHNRRWRDLDARSRSSGRWRTLDTFLPEGALTLRDVARQLAVEAASLGASVTHRFTRLRPRQTLEVSAELIPGRPGQVMVRAVDVSEVAALAVELARVRARLGKHERLRRAGELVSGVAHDVNNVLNALRLRLELVETLNARGDANLAAMRRMLTDATFRLASLQDSGRPASSTHRRVSLRRVVRDAVALFRPAGGGRGRIRVRAAVPDVRVSGASAPELRHVLLNLLLNARDAMPDGGVVTIGVRRSVEGVVLQVRDGGAGIPAEVLPRIFEPFFSSKAERGSGLGLFTARTIMTRLGGSISASNHPRGGAVLTLTFPRTPPASTKATPLPRARPTRAVGRGVLVVDHDLESRHALGALLSRWGLAVTTTATCSEALALVDGGLTPDLVLSELARPGIGPFELAAALRQRGLAPVVHVLTGDRIDPDDPRRGLVDGILAKPIGLRELACVVPLGANGLPRRAPGRVPRRGPRRRQ